MTTTELRMVPRGPFSLETVRGFACGIFSASRACATTGEVKLAFGRDDDQAVVGASLRLDDGALAVRTFGPAGDLAPQLARILGLDHDARPFHAMAAREAPIGRILAGHPGYRPVVFFSPYAAAAWAVLGQRIRKTQAAALARAIAHDAGDEIDVDGDVVASFPRPQALLARSSHPGVSAEKWLRLQAVARAALDGELSLARLRGMPYADARAHLMSIRGVGPWTADAVLMRGLGPTDALPASEPMLAAAVARAYGLDTIPDAAEVEAIAERWRPFRMWTSILLIMAHMREARR